MNNQILCQNLAVVNKKELRYYKRRVVEHSTRERVHNYTRKGTASLRCLLLTSRRWSNSAPTPVYPRFSDEPSRIFCFERVTSAGPSSSLKDHCGAASPLLVATVHARSRTVGDAALRPCLLPTLASSSTHLVPVTLSSSTPRSPTAQNPLVPHSKIAHRRHGASSTSSAL
jgi:hypothetical protein